MNIPNIAAEILDCPDTQGVTYSQVVAVLDALSILMYEEGKIADVLIVNGKKKRKELDVQVRDRED